MIALNTPVGTDVFVPSEHSASVRCGVTSSPVQVLATGPQVEVDFGNEKLWCDVDEVTEVEW